MSVRHAVDDAVVPADRQSSYLRIFKSNVFVKDYDRAMKFYVDALGLAWWPRLVRVRPMDRDCTAGWQRDPAVVAPKRGTGNYKLIGRHTQIAFIAEDIQATYDLWLAAVCGSCNLRNRSYGAGRLPLSAMRMETPSTCWAPMR